MRKKQACVRKSATRKAKSTKRKSSMLSASTQAPCPEHAAVEGEFLANLSQLMAHYQLKHDLFIALTGFVSYECGHGRRHLQFTPIFQFTADKDWDRKTRDECWQQVVSDVRRVLRRIRPGDGQTTALPIEVPTPFMMPGAAGKN